jgi:hypothetical protein
MVAGLTDGQGFPGSKCQPRPTLRKPWVPGKQSSLIDVGRTACVLVAVTILVTYPVRRVNTLPVRRPARARQFRSPPGHAEAAMRGWDRDSHNLDNRQ